ncbi:hypothetical protein AB835_03900 [Candidatus Endobugula sertula]|uniref:Uncharacterized protein n=1 Tax=Candidatus Endobugula sertula TaxID=62101 RepID=A0A1D2QS85_9GAMM|nr:hypothetical protein AB835_03900 [Candidatus Endobugula sertula]
MTKRVAKEGDVIPTPSTSTSSIALEPTVQGSWKVAEPVRYTSHNKLKYNGTPLIYKAQCTFGFSGTDSSSGKTMTDSETIILQAKPSTLKESGNNVLLHGDKAVGKNGNTLTVNSSNTLKSGF